MRLEREATVTLIVLGLGRLPKISYLTTPSMVEATPNHAMGSDYGRDEEVNVL